MQCRNCRTLFYTNFCPNCGTPANPVNPKKPILKKWWFWLIVAVTVVFTLGLFGGGDGSLTGDIKNTTPSISGDANQNASPPTTEPKQNTAKEDEYHVGDIINTNGLHITYVSAKKWESYNKHTQPADGYMYIQLKISAENKSNVDQYIHYSEFECYADGKKESFAYVIEDDWLDGGTVSSGRRTEGYIYFTVPVNAQSIEVEYETSFWTDKKAILVVDLP